MATYSAVDCCEEHNSTSEDFSDDGISCSVVLRCAWEDRYDLVSDLLVNRITWPYLDFMAHPPYAVSASINPDGAQPTTEDQGQNYQNALVTVGYSTGEGVKEDESGNEYTESLKPTAEFITLDYKRFRWGAVGGDPLIEGESPGRLFHGLSLSRSNLKVLTAAIPVSLLTLPGYVNDAAYTSSLGLVFPIETLLFQPPALSRTVTLAGIAPPTGDEAWNLEMEFAYKPDGWNQFYRAKKQEYQAIFVVDPAEPGGGSEFKSYPLGDFSPFLFT